MTGRGRTSSCSAMETRTSSLLLGTSRNKANSLNGSASNKPGKPVYSQPARRIRIAMIHQEIKLHIGECDYVFSVEDDTVLPSYALST